MILQPTSREFPGFNSFQKKSLEECIDRTIQALFNAQGGTAAVDSQVVRGILQQNIHYAQLEIQALSDYLRLS